jgi:hypothetical protein
LAAFWTGAGSPSACPPRASLIFSIAQVSDGTKSLWFAFTRAPCLFLQLRSPVSWLPGWSIREAFPVLFEKPFGTRMYWHIAFARSKQKPTHPER